MIEKLIDLKRSNIQLTQVLGVLLNRHYPNQVVCVSDKEIKSLPNGFIQIACDDINKKYYVKICLTENEADQFIKEYEKEESCDCEESDKDKVADLFVKALKDFEKSLKALADR